MWLCLLVSNRFQVLFHRASRPSFHLSLAVLVHYRYELVFSLGAWSPRFHTGVCRLSYYSGISQKSVQFHLQDFHFLWFQIPLDSTIKPIFRQESYNPVRLGFTSLRVLRPLLFTRGYSLERDIAKQNRVERFGLGRFRSSLLTAS